MLTFLEFVELDEGRINWDEYGSWISAKTREVLDVEHQNHRNVLGDYAEDRGIDMGGSFMKWAVKNNWVKVTHNTDTSFGIAGNTKDVKKVWRMVASRAMKSWQVALDLRDGPNRDWQGSLFDIRKIEQKNKLLGLVT